MTLLEILLFFLVPAIAAAINSVAGGGTFLTFPVFIMSGLTPLQANVMSTIALWPGTISSSYGYRKILAADYNKLLPLFIICVVGGAAGSLTLLHTPEVIFKQLVPWLLLIATLIFTFGRYVIVWLHKYFPNSKEQRGLGLFLQAFISFYGGYFGAGIGILMLAMLQLMGYSNIHQMNALKTLLAAAINMATVVIFICYGAVVWNLAAIMVAGGVCGGYIGARMALKVSPVHIRILVSAIGFSMSAYFFMIVV
jgi:uncharacterized membrane protein YfcA